MTTGKNSTASEIERLRKANEKLKIAAARMHAVLLQTEQYLDEKMEADDEFAVSSGLMSDIAWALRPVRHIAIERERWEEMRGI